MTREERDLMVRWARQARREAWAQPAGELPLYRLPLFPLRSVERTYALMRAIDPRTLPSVPSPRVLT